MDWFEYEWTGFQDDEPKRFPLLPLTLRSKKRTFSALALLDTGAEKSYLPRALAEKLRCLPSNYTGRARPMGEDFAVGSTWLTIEVALPSGLMSVGACEFHVPEQEGFVHQVVLGREPFFLLAEVRFQEWRKRFGIVRRPRPIYQVSPIFIRAETRRILAVRKGAAQDAGHLPRHSPRSIP